MPGLQYCVIFVISSDSNSEFVEVQMLNKLVSFMIDYLILLCSCSISLLVDITADRFTNFYDLFSVVTG